jgi:Carboxypeptidase regulatory-like domain
MGMRAIAALFILLSAGTWGLAQGPAQSNARYTVRGSVVNAVTAEPIRRALVELNGPQARRAFTGPDGSFQFEGVQGGTFVLLARRPGFMDTDALNMGQVPSQPGATTLTAAGRVTVGPDTGSITIKLVPQARVSGHVLDAEGEPVSNVTVRCLQQSIVSGHRRWRPAQSAGTDEGGNFLIDNLPPGRVLLQTLSQQVYPGLIADDDASRLIYRSQYYPNATDMAAAQPIDLNAGQDARIDFTVSVVRGTRVFFSVTPPQDWVSATLIEGSGDEAEVMVRRNIRAGGWILPSVPPGTWRLSVTSNGGSQGEANIEVGSADVRNVVVPMSEPVQVPILVSGGNSGKGGLPPVTVQLISSAPGRLSQFDPVFMPSTDRTAPLGAGATPGSYHVTVNPPGADCVESITSGSTDLSRSDYVVAAGSPPAPINVELRSDCSSIEVSATNRQQTAAVVVTGGMHKLEPLVSFIGSPGSSAAVRLAPGEYDVFAFSDLAALEYGNPEVLKNYKSQHVSLSPNQKATVSVDVNVPGEGQ